MDDAPIAHDLITTQARAPALSGTVAVPMLVMDDGDAAARRFAEFFVAAIRNPHTRRLSKRIRQHRQGVLVSLPMSELETRPVTADELLPALIELASIQQDLLQALEHPSPATSVMVPPRVERNRLAGDYSHTPVAPVGINTSDLRRRSLQLLKWLIDRIEGKI